MQLIQADKQSVQEIGKIIERTKVAMVTTQNARERLVSRPLHTRATEFDGELWFFTARDSMKVHEIEANPHVNVAYANAGDGSYLSLVGRAAVVHDQKRIDELWVEEVDSLFFKGGKTDPNLLLLKVSCESAELWTSSSTWIGRAFQFLKAQATRDVGDLGEHRHVELQR